jgi:hypothetical protein
MVTIDATPPSLALTAAPASPARSRDATFAFTVEADASVRCSLATAAAAFAPCDSPSAHTGLADGGWTFAVEAEDVAGNVTRRSHAFVVDATAPGVAITSAPPADSASSTARFAFATPDGSASLTCSLDGAAAATCSSPVVFGGLTDGAHAFTVHATDPAGNVSSDTRTVRVDTRMPVVTLTARPSPLGRNATPSFSFAGDEAALTFTCSLSPGIASAAPCASPVVYPALSDGSLTFTVVATDAAGNASAPAEFAFTIDTRAPAVTIDEKPAARTRLPDVRFAFSSEPGAAFECSLSSGADSFAPCSSPRVYAATADGAHTFKVRAADGAGNVSATVSYAFAVDTVAPAVSITSGPSGAVNDIHPLFTFASEPGATFECSLSQAAASWAPCTSPAAFSTADDGAYRFSVRATDQAGNTGPAAERTFVLDTAGPAVTITRTPAAQTADATPDIAFSSEPGATFECSLTTGAPIYGPCASPHAFAAVADGTYTVRVRATDAAGNTGAAATGTFTVDTIAPVAAITRAPSNPTNDHTPEFAFSADDQTASFECSLTAGPPVFTPCSSPVTSPAQADGTYTFAVRATDAAGNVGVTVTHALTIDTAALSVVISAAPATASARTTPTFAFSATKAGVRFRCSLSTGVGTFAPCASPLTYPAQPDGAYTFTVEGTDPAGNTSTAQAAFAIDTAAPVTSILSGPSAISSSPSPAFTFAASEPGATFQCSLSAGADAFAPCASPAVYTGKADGTYVFKVRATDAAGNTGPVASTTFAIAASGVVAGAPVPALRQNAQLGTAGQLPVRLQWAAAAGATSYTLQQSVDGGAWTAVTLPTATSTSLDRQLLLGKTYRFRVRAGTGAWRTSTGFVPTLLQESVPGLVRSGAWAAGAVAGASGGSVLFASAAGATAGHTFTAVSVGVVSTLAAARGQADVYIDGIKRSTVDAYAATAQPRRLVMTAPLLPGQHTLELKVLGKKTSASTATRIDLDALALVVAVP